MADTLATKGLKEIDEMENTLALLDVKLIQNQNKTM
jgi:hypothetical protein